MHVTNEFYRKYSSHKIFYYVLHLIITLKTYSSGNFSVKAMFNHHISIALKDTYNEGRNKQSNKNHCVNFKNKEA